MIVLLWPRCRVPGSPLTVNIYSGDIVYIHTHTAMVPRSYTHLSARYGMDLMLVRKCWCWDLQWWNVGLSADIVHLWPDLGPGEE